MLSPLFPPWFLMNYFLVFVLDLLMVFFRSALLRSRSCSTGDSLCFTSGTNAWLKISFRPSFVLALTTWPLFLPFPYHYVCLTVTFIILAIWFLILRFPHYFLLNFLSIISWFRYSASCLFPFALSCSLPQLLRRWFPLITQLGTSAWPSFSFVHFDFSTSLLGFLFLPFPSCWLCLTAVRSVFDSAFALSISPFSWSWSLIFLIEVLVLGFLFVSFRSYLFRSHSRFTDSSLGLLFRVNAWLLLSFVHSSFST